MSFLPRIRQEVSSQPNKNATRPEEQLAFPTEAEEAQTNKSQDAIITLHNAQSLLYSLAVPPFSLQCQNSLPALLLPPLPSGLRSLRLLGAPVARSESLVAWEGDNRGQAAS